MLIEDQSTNCPNCKKPLTWKSIIKHWEQGKLVDEFSFSCESCKREYQFKEGQLIEKRPLQDPLVETLAIKGGQQQVAVNRRCLQCGGPITDGPEFHALRCD